MRESEAWRVVAENEAEVIGSPFLCHQIDRLEGFRAYTVRVIERAVAMDMQARLADHMEAAGWAFVAFPCTNAKDWRSLRVLAALFLALEAEDEGR